MMRVERSMNVREEIETEEGAVSLFLKLEYDLEEWQGSSHR